jgi:membrane protein insertase Oxa1/YidC/SpoIIIJ
MEKVKANAEIMSAVQGDITAGVAEEEAIYNYFVGRAQDAVVNTYKTKVIHNTSFGWIKNIWVTDASYKHPILPYMEFEAEISRENFEVNGKEVSLSDIKSYTNVYGEEQYNLITGKLTAPKAEANGYFVLILLSIGTILLQQFVSMRSQKEQQQFSSVDGQGASQQKMMMIIMTGMFAIFSFMYSSAFSIYMIMSNVLSLFSLVIINKLVDKNMEKKEEKAFKEKWARRFARTPNADDKNKKKK